MGGDDFDAWEDSGGSEVEPDTSALPQAKLDPEKLLDRLFDRGVLPRYAFPTDVVTFYVFDAVNSTEWRMLPKYSPQLGLNQALSGYAPGREVWVNGEKHYSFAIWSPFSGERWSAWKQRKVYFECTRCHYATLESRTESHAGAARDCPACKTPGSCLGAEWLRPVGFAHPVDLTAALAVEDSPAPTRPTRAKLSAAFIDGEPDSPPIRTECGSGFDIWSRKQRLVITNTGSRERSKPGFLHCPACGRTEPNGWTAGFFTPGKPHRRPNPDHRSKGPLCDGTPTWRSPVVLGNEFETDIALFRFQLAGSVTLPPGSVVAKIVLTTVAEALASAAAKILDIEESDIGAEYRVAMTSGGRTGNQVEVYLYDLTPGGAGFVRTAAADPTPLFEQALERLEGCDCTHSCYQCLRSYKNKWDHKYLDRTLAAAFIRHVVHGEAPTLDADDEERLLRALEVDLVESGHVVERVDSGLRLPELAGRVVVLGHPLTPGEAGTAAGRQRVAEGPHVVVDKLVVDRALPAAVREATGALAGDGSGFTLPPFLPETAEGLPVYEPADLAGDEEPEPLAKVSVPGAPDGSFVAQLARPTLERMGNGELAADAWVVFTPTEADDFAASNRDHTPRLLISEAGAFNATNDRWTFGLPRLRKDKVSVLYRSHVAPRSETPLATDVKVVGRAYGVFVDGVLLKLGGA